MNRSPVRLLTVVFRNVWDQHPTLHFTVPALAQLWLAWPHRAALLELPSQATPSPLDRAAPWRLSDRRGDRSYKSPRGWPGQPSWTCCTVQPLLSLWALTLLGLLVSDSVSGMCARPAPLFLPSPPGSPAPPSQVDSTAQHLDPTPASAGPRAKLLRCEN